MDTNEIVKFIDAFSEALAPLVKAVKSFTDVISEFFDSLVSKNENIYRLPKKYFKSPKKYRINNVHNLYKAERRVQRHLPYQRRNY